MQTDFSVLYVSVHRYEHGAYWPHLRESDFDFIGDGEGKGFNVNVPINEVNLILFPYRENPFRRRWKMLTSCIFSGLSSFQSLQSSSHN